MNAATILGTILSLMLALATTGSTTSNAPSERPVPPGHNLNHNETLVRDDATYQTSDALSLQFAPTHNLAPVVIQLFVANGCSPLVCGSNHNETLVRDAR